MRIVKSSQGILFATGGMLSGPNPMFDPLTQDPDIFAMWEPYRQSTLDGSLGVISMAGQVGSEGLLQQTSSSNRPLFVPSVLNNKALIQFTGANSHYLFSDQPASTWKFLHDGSDYTFYILFYIGEANPGSRQGLICTAGSTSDIGIRVIYDDINFNNGGNVKIFNGITSDLTLDTVSEDLPTQTWQVLCGKEDSSLMSQDYSLYIDTVLKGSDTNLLGASSSNPTDTLAIGYRINGSPAYYLTGSIASIIISKAAHNSVMIDNYQTYFQGRFGI